MLLIWRPPLLQASNASAGSTLPEIKVPTLALTSEEDPLFVEHQKVMRLVPGVKGHTFEGRGPLSEPDRATEFVDAVDGFMRS